VATSLTKKWDWLTHHSSVDSHALSCLETDGTFWSIHNS